MVVTCSRAHLANHTLCESQHVQVQAANILFVDNPVGTGYSYCESDEAFTTNVDEIATDLVAFFSGFLEEFPVFQVSLPSPPLFFLPSQSAGDCIYAQSWGARFVFEK